MLPGYRELKRMHIVTINGPHVQLAGDYRRAFLAGEDLPSWSDLSVAVATRHHAAKKSPAQLQSEINESLAKRYPHTMGKAGLWHHRAKETREQIASERAAAGMSPPYERFQIGDAVQFRSEPGTGGVIIRFESEPSEGRSWARVATSRGERRVPTDSIRRVRKEHEERVRRAVEGKTAHAVMRTSGRLIDAIRPGSRVTIVDRFGKQRTGRAVMRGPYGWVLNMGGAHGTPAIATDDNITAVKG